jgi:hypothetical protein
MSKYSTSDFGTVCRLSGEFPVAADLLQGTETPCDLATVGWVNPKDRIPYSMV